MHSRLLNRHYVMVCHTQATWSLTSRRAASWSETTIRKRDVTLSLCHLHELFKVSISAGIPYPPRARLEGPETSFRTPPKESKAAGIQYPRRARLERSKSTRWRPFRVPPRKGVRNRLLEGVISAGKSTPLRARPGGPNGPSEGVISAGKSTPPRARLLATKIDPNSGFGISHPATDDLQFVVTLQFFSRYEFNFMSRN